MRVRNRHIPIRSTPDDYMLPDPWSIPFEVPRASKMSWIKAVLILTVGASVLVLALRSF